MMIVPPHSSSYSSSCPLHHLTLDDVKPGCFYEIDPSRIPPKYPDQIKQIRIVMVSEKTESRISLRCSSTYSLRCHFSSSAAPHCQSTGVGKNILPPLNEKYIVDSEAACQVLLRRVSPEELADRKMALDFWVAQSTSAPVVKTNRVNRKGDVDGTSMSALLVAKKGSCWSELWDTNMVSWGKRRRVRFLNRHEESREDKHDQLLALTQGCEDKNNEQVEEASDNKEDNEKMDDKITVKPPAREKTKLTQKRKRCAGGRGAGASTKKRSTGNLVRSMGKQVQVYALSNWRKAKATGTINRWSAERYKLAEENMLKIMKESGAVFTNPIMRPVLRTEARKLIGDTGLLDHLLKHMSGKLAPGGEERFRRRHNADGAMEYWLESADLVDLRRQAGVDDPFWTPPHGWKLGDNPSQDPVCAREIRELREEVSILKRDIDQLAMVVFESHRPSVALTTPSSRYSGLDLEQVIASIISLKEMCNELVRKDAGREERVQEMVLSLNKMKVAMEELVVEMALSIKGMKEEIGKLKWAVESNKAGLGGDSMLLQKMANGATGGEDENVERKKGGQKDRGTPTVDTAAAAIDETMLVMLRAQKAEKLRRLRSEFKICKPQASFEGPAPTTSKLAPAAAADHLLPVPTPPSMSSASAAAASPLSQACSPPQPGSPFKPMAERYALTMRPFALPTGEYPAVGINLNDNPITYI